VLIFVITIDQGEGACFIFQYCPSNPL